MTDESRSKPESATPPRRRRWGRIVLISLLSLIVVVTIVIALAPMILSGFLGGTIAGAASDRIRGSVRIGSVSLSWFGDQQVSDLVLLDPQGEPVIEVERMSTELSLWDAIWGNLDLGETLLQGLDGNIVVNEAGETNLQRATASAEPAAEREDEPTRPDDSEPMRYPESLRMQGRLVDANLRIVTPDQPPVLFTDVNAAIDITGPTNPITLALAGQTQQGEVSGRFDINGQVADLFNAQRELTIQAAVADLTANVTDLPVVGLDALAGLEGLLVAALGEQLDLTATANATAAQQTFQITVEAPRLQAAVNGRAADDMLTLIEPARVNFTATPVLVQQLVQQQDPQSQMRLAEPVGIAVSVPRLTVPLDQTQLGSATNLRAELTTSGPIRLTGVQEVGPVTIANLQGLVDTERLSEALTFALNADVVTDAPGKVAINGTARNVMTDHPMALDATAQVDQLPIALVDRIAGLDGLLVEAVGPTASLQATAQSAGEEPVAVNLALNAARLQAQSIAFTIGEQLRLTSPAVVQMTVTPALAQRFLPADSEYRVMDAVPVTLTLNQLVAALPEEGEPAFHPAATVVEATLQPGPVTLAGLPTLQQIALQQTTVALRGESLAKPSITLQTTLAQPGEARQLAALAGAPQVDIAAGVTTTLGPEAELGPIASKLRITSPQLNATSQATIAADFATARLTDTNLNAVLTPEALRVLGLVDPAGPTLAGPAQVTVQVEPTTLPLAEFDLSRVQTQMRAGVDQLVLAADDPALRGAGLSDLNVTVGLNEGVVKLAANGQTRVPGQTQPGPIAVNATVTNLFADAAPGIDGDARIENLPTGFVQAVTGQQDLVTMIGPAVNVQARAQVTGGDQLNGNVQADLTSQLLQANAALAMQQNVITAAQPIQVKWTLTPAAYAALTGPAPDAQPAPPAEDEPVLLMLQEPADVSVTIPTLTLALRDEAANPQPAQPADQTGEAAEPTVLPIDPTRSALEANFTSGPMRLQDPATNQVITLANLQGQAAATKLSERLNVQLRSAVRSAPVDPGADAPPGAIGRPAEAAPAEGSLQAELALVNFVLPDGELDTDAMTVLLNAQLENFPTSVIDQLGRQEGLVVAALGPVMQLTTRAQLQQMQGPIDAEISAANASATLKALFRDEAITLREPLVASFRVTEPLGRQVLANVNPIFESIQSGEQPIQLTVPVEGVMVPTADFDMARVQVPTMRLEMGRMVLRNGGAFGQLLGLIQRLGRLEGHGAGGQTPVWFTPLVAGLENGRFVYQRRLDLLIDGSFHAAMWGTVNLPSAQQEQVRFDLVFGIPAPTLDRVFDLEDLPADAMFRIPLSGVGGQIDYGAATQQAAIEMGRLQAQSRLKGRGDVGALFDLGQEILGGQKRGEGGALGRGAPPASVDPLPWGEAPAQQRTEPDAEPPGTIGRPAQEQPQQQPMRRQQPERRSDRDALIDLGGQLLQDVLRGDEQKQR